MQEQQQAHEPHGSGDARAVAPQADLDRSAYRLLAAEALAQWKRGDEMLALIEIREHGSDRDYEEVVNMICAYDDAERDAEIESRVQRTRAQRGD